MKRRSILAAAFALAAMPAFAQAPIKINWWHGMSGPLGEALEAVVADFNKSQAKYQVIAVSKGNYVATLNAAIAAYRANEQPHLLQNNAHDLADQHGLKLDPNTYLRPVIDTYTDRNGRLLAMPFNSSTPILFYNQDMLAKAGIAAPPKTWQEMEEQIKKIKASGAGECGYSFAAGPWQELENYSVWHDIPFATKNNGFGGLDAELMINKTRAVQHIDRLARWSKEGLASFGAAAKATWASGARTNFIEGKCAFWIDSTAWHSTVAAGAKMKWSATSLPHEQDIQPNRSMIGGAA
ncbi:MAG: extracellular solute-binding protein, partial [Alphaproteobacteria bacterium]|nr:extracellular solute-binding protein [Alphaproteobacteria bacterium]